MSIVSWLRVDWLLNTVDVTLYWHVLIVAITFTRAITIIGILGIKVNSLLLCICYVATWLLVYQINFLALVSCLILRWIGISLNWRWLIERSIVWDFGLLKTWTRVHVLVLKASLGILASLDMIPYLLRRHILGYIWNRMSNTSTFYNYLLIDITSKALTQHLLLSVFSLIFWTIVLC